MNNHLALDPHKSVVVEACAGSGKTWLLVSRIVRLLLAGVRPSEILAITFTRKAAQEMQARLHEWLHLLATKDDAAVKDFLGERGLHEVDGAVLARARDLYRALLLAQPGITINTFHGWFMQIIQRAPLNAGLPVGMQLLERTSALLDEAWQAFAESLRAAPESEAALRMQWLFEEYGLHNTRMLLNSFVGKRAEWWAYTNHLPSPLGGRGVGGEGLGERAEVVWAMEQLCAELDVDPDADPIAAACANAGFCSAVQAFARALATGTEPQSRQANQLQAAWDIADTHQRYSALTLALYTKAGEPRSFNPTKKQNADAFMVARDALIGMMQAVRDELTGIRVLRMNEAALHCGATLLEHYQQLKLRSQQMDFTDVEWQVCRMLNQSDCAEYMQYKLDSRYRHVLMDEFQDTNPLQWQILKSWFEASVAVDARPTVFVVGDPKQSIYRFRRADARLFGEVRRFLERKFGAHYLTQNETRRNAPAVLSVVNSVFSGQPDGFVDFEAHYAHHLDLPGYVEVMPLCQGQKTEDGRQHDPVSGAFELRNPLVTPRAEKQSAVRELEAGQFAAAIADMVAHWSVQEKGITRRAEYRDIMVLVRRRTHLRVYEHALRARHIPFLTSRRGGLLDTLEAEDIQALLTFLTTPFADLELAQVLRSPIFSCTDDDLMRLAADGEGNWWLRLQRMAQSVIASLQIQRAYRLLGGWLQRADKLPVHDLLDRIYFEGDLARRYAAALPVELRETVRANLQAFMEIALNVDAGRYPSLPRFLTELNELRNASDNESPDEGKVGEIGNALQIYTVHEAKGLEAPIVWLLDANDTQRKADSYGVLLDWPPNATSPVHFSLYADKRSRGARRMPYFDADERYARREEMNLLYVAMTRAKQALLVSGNGEFAETSWYGRIAAAAEPFSNPLLGLAGQRQSVSAQPATVIDDALLQPAPAGRRTARATAAQQKGIWLHALLQHLAPPSPLTPLPLAGEGSAVAPEITSDLPAGGLSRMASSSIREVLQQRCGIPPTEMESLWQQAHQLLARPDLQRYFDPQHYRAAFNEMPYVNARGELHRIDRLVEFDDEVWVLDYKVSEQAEPGRYRAQMQEYRAAMQAVYAGKRVRCALLFMDGALSEVE